MHATAVRRHGVWVAPLCPGDRRARLLRAYDVDLVLDVGANAGQYASALRAAGHEGRIVSFERLGEPYRELAAAAAADARWDAWRVALGAGSGEISVNVAQDTRNSSVLAVGERHVRAVPDSRAVGSESVGIERLDVLWPRIANGARRPHLKIDTQGYELEVLRGAVGVLDAMVLVEAELSLVSTYDAGPLFQDVVAMLAERRFAPIAFEGVLDDADTGEMLQVDAIFRST
jgi:FkbM family methyltransferase